MTLKYWIFGAIALAGCAATTPAAVDPYSAVSTEVLWQQQSIAATPQTLALVEAELGSRGETYSDGRYLGKATHTAYGRKLYDRTSAGAAVGLTGLNCDDFTSSAEAQKYFLANGGPSRDPHNLDGDGDGLACEWGRQLAVISKKYSYSSAKVKLKPAVVYHRPRYSSTCHIGPRGGRYTILANGRKNYGGC